MSKESLKLKLKEFEEMKFPSEPENLDVIAELDTTGDGITGNIEAFWQVIRLTFILCIILNISKNNCLTMNL